MSANLLEEARLRPYEASEDAPVDWMTGFSATLAGFVSEDQSASTVWWRDEAHKRRRSLIEGLTKEPADWYDNIDRAPGHYQQVRVLFERGDLALDQDGVVAKNSVGEAWLASYRPVVEATRRVLELEKRFPGQGISDGELKDWTKNSSREVRALTSADRARGPTSAAIAGVLVGAVTDPVVAATLPFGAPAAGAAKGAAAILKTAAKVGGQEAVVQGALQLPIQAQVFAFKDTIESPYTVKEAALNTLAAGLGAGLLRGAGSAATDVVGSTLPTFGARASELLEKYATRRAKGEKFAPEIDTAARDLGEHLDEVASNPFGDLADGEAVHAAAIEKATADSMAFEPVRVEAIVRDAVGDDASKLKVIDPRELEVDAETFQFKAGGDVEGVTERLKGVERFDPMLAGQVLVYETKAGRRFIVDGHQRLGLAKRAIAAGQEPAEVKLFGYILREADGMTVSHARRLAALKNIAEGTGTAVDAAKILREPPAANGRPMPPLPPNSALVRDAQGLARLSDDAFKAVINEVVPAQYAATVGQLIEGPKEQLAVLQLLARAEPANATQARMMVEQARAAGFETRTTDDLFGETEVAESFFVERAKVADAALRTLRRDRATFRTLADRGETIAAEGNVLDQAANARRLAEDEEALASLARQFNTKGPISEALTAAARSFKEGKKLDQVTRQFLADVKAARAHRVKPEGAPPAAEFRETIPEGDPLLTPTNTIDTPERVKLRERIIKSLLKGTKPTKKGERPVAVLMAGGGGSGKSAVLRMLEESGDVPEGAVRLDPDDVKVNRIPEFRAIAERGDWRASTIVHDEGSDIVKAALDAALAKRIPVIYDRTMGDPTSSMALIAKLKKAGYDVRIVGVTVSDRSVAWARAMDRARRSGRYVPRNAFDEAHDGFERNLSRYVDEADEAVVFDNTTEGAPPRVIATKTAEGVDVADTSLYTRFGKEKTNAEANAGGQAQEGAGRPEAVGQGARGAEAPGAGGEDAAAGTRPGELDDLFGGATATAQGLHRAQLEVAARLSGPDVPVGQGEGDLFSGASKQADLTDYLGDSADDAARIEADYQAALAENPLLDVPVRTVEGRNGLELELRPAGELVEELDAQVRALSDVRLCAVGS